MTPWQIFVPVMPARAGIHLLSRRSSACATLDSRFRGNDVLSGVTFTDRPRRRKIEPPIAKKSGGLRLAELEYILGPGDRVDIRAGADASSEARRFELAPVAALARL